MKKLLAACTAALRAVGLAGGRASSLAPRHATRRPRLTKIIAGSTTAVLAIGLAVVGVAAPASAHTPTISSTCSVLSVNLTGYAASVAATDPTYTTEYTRWKYTLAGKPVVGSTPLTTPNEWTFDVKGKPKQDPIGAVFQQGDNGNGSYFFWTGAQVVDQQGTPAKTNHVTVTIDGVVKADVDFSTSYSNTFTYADSTSVHNWIVKVTAWDDSSYSKTYSGASTPCVAPTVPTFTASVCTTPGNSSTASYTIPTVAGVKYQIRIGGNADGSGNGYTDKAAGTYTLAAGSTIHVIAVGNGKVLTGDDGPWNFTAASAGTCLSDVTPAVPTFTAEVCTTPGASTPGSYVIPATTGVVYSVKVNSGAFVVKSAGTYAAADGDVISVKADAASGYKVTGTASWPFTFADAGLCLSKATPVEPTIVSIVKCGTDGSVTPVAATGVTYTVTPAGATSGVYTVTAIASTGYYFAQDAITEWTGNLGEHTECATPVKPAVTDAVCDVATGTITPGTITIPATTGVSYLIDGLAAGAGAHTATPGAHTVSALANSGYTLVGDSSFSVTVGAAGDCFIPVQPAAATPSAETCVYATGALTSGYITIPESEHVTFTIDNGTYTAGDYEFANGDHTVIVTADAGYVLVGDASYVVKIDTAGECLTPVTPSDPTAQPQLCDLETGGVVGGSITVGDLTNVDYTIDGVAVTHLATVVDSGEHTVVATAKEGYRLEDAPDGDVDENGQITWTLTVAAAGSCDLPTYAAWDASATATDELCGILAPTSGTISVVFPMDDPTAVRYFIGTTELTSATTNEVPGTYTVTAEPRYPNETILGTNSWTLTVAAAGTDCGELPTYAAFDASASATNQLCTAGSTTSGFISVVFPADDPSAVQYFIGDRELTSANTAVAPGTYTVTAVTRDANDTILGQSSWTLTVAAVAAACGELTTLAFTGVNGNLGGMLMLAMFLLIAGAGVYTSTRVRIRKN